MMTSEEFTGRLKAIAGQYETTYMWGVFGAPVTDALIDQKVAQYPNFYTGPYQQRLRQMAGRGIFAFDCVCLLKGVLWGWTGDKTRLYGGARYASEGVPDLNADAMMRRCSGLSTDFSAIEPGEAVGIRGHIGVYVGEGRVVECTTDWDCKVQLTYLGNHGRIEGLHGRRWERHGKLPYLLYDAAQPPALPENPENSENPEDSALRVGDRVGVRAGARDYEGGSLAPFVYETAFTLQSLMGDRAVIGLDGRVTAAMHRSDLIPR